MKVYVKTWDGNEDVTAEYTPVTEIMVPDRADGEVALMVWNSDDWRRLCTAPAADGAAVFGDVGCRLNQALCFRQDGMPDMVCDLRSDGSFRWLDLSPGSDDMAAGFTVNYDKTTPLGEMSPDEDYYLLYYSEEGWLATPSERLSTGGFTFTGNADRLYRITGPGIANRPFTVELDANGEVVTLKR